MSSKSLRNRLRRRRLRFRPGRSSPHEHEPEPLEMAADSLYPARNTAEGPGAWRGVLGPLGIFPSLFRVSRRADRPEARGPRGHGSGARPRASLARQQGSCTHLIPRASSSPSGRKGGGERRSPGSRIARASPSGSKRAITGRPLPRHLVCHPRVAPSGPRAKTARQRYRSRSDGQFGWN